MEMSLAEMKSVVGTGMLVFLHEVCVYSSIISEYDDRFFNLDWLVPLVQEEENASTGAENPVYVIH